MCFLSHVLDDQAIAIISCLGFQLGSFLARFLGLLLITTKLSLTDCKPLLERIRNWILSWTNRILKALFEGFFGRVLPCSNMVLKLLGVKYLFLSVRVVLALSIWRTGIMLIFS